MPSSSTPSTLPIKWNQRYRNSENAGEACWVLKNNCHLLPKNARSLDLACGLGANALLLARYGLESHGWDLSTQALEKLSTFAKAQQLSVCTKQRDVEQQPPEANSFDIIVVSQFLYRPIFPALINALKPKGLLFYQTFHQLKQGNLGPNTQKFLLQPNELLSLLSPLRLVFYREDSTIGQTDLGLRDCSYFIGQRLDK